MYDLIGDIHGHADELEKLLVKLNYQKVDDVYRHPDRKVIFIGDYIDRGPKIWDVLRIVRSMVDKGNAIALMGNHEYNSICFHYKESQGGHLRPHLIKNIIPHFQTLYQFLNKQQEYDDYIEWFKTLPLFFETDQFRAVHACWDPEHIGMLRNCLHDGRLNEEIILQSVKGGTDLHNAIEDTLKGKEVKLPDGYFFTDKYGNRRNDIRIRWWEEPASVTYRQLSIEPSEEIPDQQIDPSRCSYKPYGPDEKMVFFGHYWLKGDVRLLRKNICCLDFSVADNGKLAAYRLDKETEFDESKFVFVDTPEKK